MFQSYKITWDEHGNLIIRDLDIDWKVHAFKFLEENFFANDLFFSMLTDETGTLQDVYKEYFRRIINGEVCIIALDEKEEKIYGIALCKWMTKEWYSWIDMKHTLPEGTLLNKMIDVTYSLINEYYKKNPHNKFNSLHLFDYLVEPNYRYDEVFMDKFFVAISEVARNLRLPRVTTIARIQREKDECLQHGFLEINKLIYSMYIVDKKRPFDCLRDNDEMSCSLMERKLEPIIPFYELTVHELTFEEFKEKTEK